CLLSWFFFSSRRRHTRFSRDWSSDVCSSDLFAQSFRGASSRARAAAGTGAARRRAPKRPQRGLAVGGRRNAFCGSGTLGGGLDGGQHRTRGGGRAQRRPHGGGAVE